MLHSNRRWCVAQVATAEELACKLTEHVWCGCTAFQIGEYLWLNDSTSPDGAQEYAVLHFVSSTGQYFQIESITFGWCDVDQALRYIQRTLQGDDDQLVRTLVSPRIETAAEHARCQHCH